MIDAILIASGDSDKNAIAVALLFYMKNKENLDVLKLRRIATDCGISYIWLDVEGFVRFKDVKNKNLFLSRKEFEEKATLYNIPIDLFPSAYFRH